MKKLKISGATETKNGRNMDQLQRHPENTTNLDLDIDIDIDLHSENDLYEDLYCTDDQYEEQCKFDFECEYLSDCQYNTTLSPIFNGIYKKYNDYSTLVHGLYEQMPTDCSAIRMSWSNLLIYKSKNEFCYYYSVYDTSKKGDMGRYLEIGDCMDPDDVSRIISYYLETGKCFGHR